MKQKQICEHCEFYDIRRTDYRRGNCSLDHLSDNEEIIVEADDSCDKWLERSDDK